MRQRDQTETESPPSSAVSVPVCSLYCYFPPFALVGSHGGIFAAPFSSVPFRAPAEAPLWAPAAAAVPFAASGSGAAYSSLICRERILSWLFGSLNIL